MTIGRLLSTHDDGRAVLTLFHRGSVHTVNSNHPRFKEIKTLSESTDTDFADITELIDIGKQVRKSFEDKSLNGRVTLDGDRLYLDNVLLEGRDMSRRMVALMSKGREDDITSMVRFIERAGENPGGVKAISSLWNWLSERNVTFQSDGSFIAYKGVQGAKGKPGLYLSKHSGDADVNGKSYYNSQIPQRVGDIVTMPREGINKNPKIGCAAGLHAGTWKYAQVYATGFGDAMIAVKINPEDVVSVPDDAQYQKLRVCKYEVLAIVSSRLEEDDKAFFGSVDKW